MAETALVPYEIKIDLNKASNKQLKQLRAMQREQNITNAVTETFKNVPGLGLVAAWLLVEQLNNRQAFGYDRQGSDWSANLLQYTILGTYAAPAIEALGKAINPFD